MSFQQLTLQKEWDSTTTVSSWNLSVGRVISVAERDRMLWDCLVFRISFHQHSSCPNPPFNFITHLLFSFDLTIIHYHHHLLLLLLNKVLQLHFVKWFQPSQLHFLPYCPGIYTSYSLVNLKIIYSDILSSYFWSCPNCIPFIHLPCRSLT